MKRYISVLLCIVMLFALCSCGKKDSVVAVVNGEEIDVSIYQYFVSILKNQVGDAETIDGQKAADYVKEKALQEVVKLYVVAQIAEEKGVKFDDAMQKQLDGQIALIKEQAGSEEQYKQTLEQYGLNEESFELLNKYTIIQNAVMEKVTSSYTVEEINSYYNNEMVNVQQILIKTVDENNQPLSDDIVMEKEALAKDIHKQIVGGASFESLKAIYNEDATNMDIGYMVSRHSTWVKPFNDGAMALDQGQVSEVITSDQGYHIIKRFNHVDNSDMFTAFQTDIITCMYQRDVELWTQSTTVEYNDDAINSVKY